MVKKNTVIEINGRQYDAMRGTPLGAGAPAKRSIDGVISQPGLKAKPVAAKTAPAEAVTKRYRHQPAAHTATRRAHPSRTLMRHTVNKPATSLKNPAKARVSALAPAPLPAVSVAPKLSFDSIDRRRQAHASKISTSDKVRHFAPGSLPPPKPAAAHQAKATAPRRRLPTADIRVTPPIADKPDLFERALASATSHEAAKPASKYYKRPKKLHSRRRQWLNYGAAALAVLLVGGFFAYQNMANLTLKVASNRAGFAAALPGYRPTGFAVGKFAYHPGYVAINFHSDSDGRRFSLQEKPSTMDSATLLSNYVASAAGSSYQTIQSAGRTVYLYGNGDATWVNGGVWYTISGDSQLSAGQISNLATSM